MHAFPELKLTLLDFNANSNVLSMGYQHSDSSNQSNVSQRHIHNSDHSNNVLQRQLSNANPSNIISQRQIHNDHISKNAADKQLQSSIVSLNSNNNVLPNLSYHKSLILSFFYFYRYNSSSIYSN